MFRYNNFVAAEKMGIKEPFIDEAAVRFGLSRTYQVVLREMEVYGPGGTNNLALNVKRMAGGQVETFRGFGWKPDATNQANMGRLNSAASTAEKYFDNLAAINDGNPRTGANSIGWRVPISGWYGLDFGKKSVINKIVLHLGNDGANIADHYVLQYWNGVDWQDIPGTEVRTNMEATAVHQFAPIETEKLRLLIYSEAITDKIYPPGEEWRWWFPHYGDLCEKLVADRPFLIYVYETRLPMESFAYKALAALKNKFGDRFLGLGMVEWPNYRNLSEFKDELAKKGREINRSNMLAKAEREIKLFSKNVGGELVNTWSGLALPYQYAEWGSPLVAFETTQCYGPDAHEIPVMYARGAARRYGKAWRAYIAHDLSYGPNGNELTYDHSYMEKQKKAGVKCYVGPEGGISTSLYRRILYFYYMSGANFIDHESSGGSEFIATYPDGRHEVSPHGKVVKEWFEFTKRNPDRGAPYTPIGIMMNWYDNYCPNPAKMWAIIDYKKPDIMIDKFFRTLFPARQAVQLEQDGVGLVNSPYGDIFDVIVPDLPDCVISQSFINGYKAQILLGDIDVTQNLAEKLKEYVASGGTLVVNVGQVNRFMPGAWLGVKIESQASESRSARSLLDGTVVSSDSFEYQGASLAGARPVVVAENNDPLVVINDYKRGRVILTLIPYMLNKDNTLNSIFLYLVKEIGSEALPVAVLGDIEYMINKTDTGFLITLINNKGVYKQPSQPPVIKPEEAAEVTLIFRLNPANLVELAQNLPIAWKKGQNQATVTVPPGGVAVVRVFAAVKTEKHKQNWRDRILRKIHSLL